uniref:Ral GTPase-activating protein subunit alpha/beta N-terminal domain-containing protein n=1 Tax=Ditylenchus dipsaci TaxID=166011 RepID=A0A915CX25_9BILA
MAGFDPAGLRITPIIVNGSSVAVPTTTTGSSTSPTINEQASVRERAQTLQIYLDKFLEYCSRETMKIEWADDLRRVDCAKFLLDRVIVLYVYEVFPDIETDGVDVFGGLDTADPQVIARYWLIRWMINIASAGFHEQPSSGLLLYRQVLLSSQKATNNLLTLMREAMQLPLACSNVIHKVLALIRYWLLQKEIPVFVESGLITLEAWNLLLIHIYTSFFNSPYLVSSGDRLPSAISLTHSILQMSRDLANPSVSVLPRQLPKSVWAELLKRLSQALTVCCARSDAYGSATAGGFTRTLLSVCVFVRVIREVELDERMWDDVWLVFKAGIWTQMVEQWSKVVENVTRALILNLFAIDVSNLIDPEGVEVLVMLKLAPQDQPVEN